MLNMYLVEQMGCIKICKILQKVKIEALKGKIFNFF
jgi:hypothetical protein